MLLKEDLEYLDDDLVRDFYLDWNEFRRGDPIYYRPNRTHMPYAAWQEQILYPYYPGVLKGFEIE
jgi:hypothetical protein